MMSKLLFLFFLTFSVSSVCAQPALKVVLDPGHGGRDSVTRGGKYLEKDIVLNIAREIKSYLLNKGMNVKLTREDDVFVSLGKRASVKGDVFISLHANSVADSIGPSVRSMIKGIEIYTSSQTNEKLAARSKLLSSSFSTALQHVDGISFRARRSKALAVLQQNLSPAILIELGFLSNEEDLSFLANKENYKKLAEAFYNALKTYHKAILPRR